MYLKANLKAAAYAAQGRLCCAHMAAIRQRQQDKSQEKARSRSTAKAKNQHRFPQKERRKEERRDRCFSVVLKYIDPSLKNFFKGATQNIFFQA